MPHYRFVSFAAALALFSCYVGADAQEEVPYSEAEFQIPADLTRAVLHIDTSTMSGAAQSITLYGNGRFELSDSRAGEYVGQLEFAELEQVLANAIAHGLAEWDEDAIYAKKFKKEGRRPSPDPVDGRRVAVLLRVDDYRRGTIQIDRVERGMKATGPDVAAERYPEIPQFQGLLELLDWMREQIQNAKESE
jgi:hypothetical protein